MRKNRCQLCGGKIRQGRCELCGWINQEDREYLLNVSACDHRPLTHVHGEGGQETDSRNGKSKKAAGKFAGKQGTPDNKKPRKKKSYKKSGIGKSVRGKSRIMIFLLLAAIILSVGSGMHGAQKEDGSGLDIGLIEKIKEGFGSQEDSGEASIEEHKYDYVTRELSRQGDSYEEEFSGGNYIVGVHLPEGTYEVQAMKGSGGVIVTDSENGIYLYQAMAKEPSYDDEKAHIKDLRLYMGASLEVNTGFTVRLASQNAQTDSMKWKDNPLSEEILLRNQEATVVGEGFPAGVYDLMSTGNPGDFDYEITVEYENGESSSYEYSIFMLQDEEGVAYYRNLILPEGTLVRAEGTDVTLIPSERILNKKYKEYYQ